MVGLDEVGDCLEYAAAFDVTKLDTESLGGCLALDASKLSALEFRTEEAGCLPFAVLLSLVLTPYDEELVTKPESYVVPAATIFKVFTGCVLGSI